MLDKNLQRVKINQVIGSQLPNFAADENPLFVEFLKQYYISQEYQGGPTDISENIDKYLNLENFQEENYLTGKTKLNGSIAYYDDTIVVDSTDSWPSEYGLLKIDNEIITYTGKTATTFTGCIRGFSGIENLHKTNNPEFLVFSSSLAANHEDNTEVQNLSNLFLREFWKQLKVQFLPGFENRELADNLDQAFFLSRAKDFYASKGTDEALKILFKVLYADNVKVIKPQEYLIRPSSADWLVTKNIIVEKVSGDPLTLNGQTLFQDSPRAIGQIYNIELYSLEGNSYYLVKLSDDSITGNFVLNGFTKNTRSVSEGDSVITVDSTLGFDESGSLYVDGQVIPYTNKSSTQFLGCSGIVDPIPLYSGIHQNRFAYSYENGDLTKKVELRITGTISKFDLENSFSKYLSAGDEIKLKTLGENIKKGSYNQKFDYWMHNPIINIDLIDATNKFSSEISPTFVTTKNYHNLRRGDSVTLLTSGLSEITGTVTDVLYSNNTDRINNRSNVFEFTFSGALNKNLQYTLRKNINFATSSVHSNINGLFSEIQNTYIDKSKENLYVTSSSLPKYQVTSTNRSVSFTVSTESDTIVTIDPHNFYSGQKVYLTSISGSLSGIATDATYFVKKLNDNSFKLSYSLSRIDNEDYITFSGIGTHRVTPFELNNKSIQDQKLFKKFPIVPQAKNADTIDEYPTVGLFLNGVEIKSNNSGDTVYYGQINSIDVLNSGSGYDVISPPKITVTDSSGSGTGAEANACMMGKIDSIIVTNPGYDFEKVPSVTIVGGNGKNSRAEARLKSVQFSVNFNGGPVGVNTSTNTIGFSTNHTFKNGEELIYQSQNNTEIGIGATSGSTSVDGYLVNNSTYYAKVLDNTTIQLMNTLDDALSGINPIPLNQESSGTHSFLTKNFRKVIDFIQVTNPGEGYKNNPIEVASLNYPPVFPGISTAIVGISTEDDYIFAKNHGFETGEEITYSTSGTAISGLSTEKSYYAYKIDDSKFRLIEKIVGVSTITGIGTTSADQNLIDTNYTKLYSIGSGTHTFNYPPIQVKIEGSVKTTESFGQPSAVVVSTGVINRVFLKSGGSNFGSNILNYDKQPTINVSSGSGALLRPVIVDGKIDSVYVLDGGSGYVSPPNLIVVGDGKYAKLKAIISDESIISVQIIDSGKDYTQEKTTILVESLGSDAKLSANIQKWNVNSYYKYSFGSDDGVLIPSFDDDRGIQFMSVYAPKNLRRILGDNLTSTLTEVGINTVHSPILGWAYDGNPIYGPYGGSSASSSSNPRILLSGYIPVIKLNRPSLSEFPEGFFLEDYEYNASGDLDEYNGRYCITPEFPNGTYAYFATRQQFPYVINKFKNNPDLFNFNLLNNQSSNLLLDGSLSRNTTPYRLTETNVSYNGLNDASNKREKFIVESIYNSGITSVSVIEPGDNYKVGEYVKFDEANTGGRGVSAQIDRIKGKAINSIVYSENLLDLNFVYSGSRVTAISTTPHNLTNNDVVVISGIDDRTFKFFEGSYSISVPSVITSLQESVGTLGSTGIITSIQLTESTSSNRLCVDDILQVENEQLLIIRIDQDENRYIVERGHNSTTPSAHAQNSTVTLKPKRFNYAVNNQSVQEVIRENKVTYFDPNQSVGLGTLGSKYFIGYGVSFTSVGISTGTTTRIFFDAHAFNPSEFVQIIGGTPSGINTSEARITSVGSTFINIEFNSSALTSVGNTSTVLLKQFNFIGPKSIYVPCLSCGCESVPFQTFEPFRYSSNAGFGISVSEYDNLSNPFALQDNQIVYVTRLSEASNTLGIRTTRSGIGSLSTLYIVGIGSTGAKKHSLTTVNPVVSGTGKKYTTSIFTEGSHGISTSSSITLNVVPNRFENVTLTYNSQLNKLLVNPLTFASTAVGVGTTLSNIRITNHTFKSGDKIVYNSQNPASPLENNQVYYVIKASDNFIKLANSYSDSIKNEPVNVAITTTGSGNHQISLINPKLSFTKGNTIGFGISNASLLNFELKFYLDSDFENEYSNNNIIKVGNYGDQLTTTQLNFKTDSETPTVLYYQIVQKGLTEGSEYSISVDKDVKDFSKIILENSVYSSTISVTGIGSTELKINNAKKPEHNSYTSSNTSELSYTTSDTSASGGIDKIKLLFEGVGYEKLPSAISVRSENGTGSILKTSAENIGRIKSATVANIGYNYSADKTIAPKAELPTLIKVKNNFTLRSVGISSGGSGYLLPPTPIVIGYPNTILESQLSGTSVNSVNIVLSDNNLSEIPPQIVSTKNTNGIIVTNAQSDGTFNTLTLKRPANGFTNFPFILGDKIFVEGVELVTPLSSGGGYNSSNYNYQTFEITSLINDANDSKLTYRIPVGLGTTGGIFDSTNSSARVINEKDLAKFTSFIQEENFYPDESIATSNGSSFKILSNGWDANNKIIKAVDLNGDLSIGSTILGNASKTKATIVDIEYLDGGFIVDSFVRKNNGWQDSVGVTNDYFQRIHDSFYYQYFSYAINSTTPYSTWEEPVNSLAHPSGFKAFSNLNIFSKSENNANVNVEAGDISLLIDISNVASLYTRSAFDLGSEEVTSRGISKFIKTSNKKLVSYNRAVSNKVIILNDISSQFTGIVTTLGGNVVGLNSFRLLSGNDNVLYAEFNATNSNVIKNNDSIINIPNHNFSTGEMLIYNSGPGGSRIGIGTTNRVLSGVSTDLLPSEVFVYKVNSSQIRLSGIKTDATTNNIFFTFRNTSGSSVAIGKTHNFSVSPSLANSRSLITIDNIIQSPLFRKNINVGLSTSVGIGSTQISLVTTKNITTNTLLQIDDEILKVNVVGLGTTTNVTVSRGQLNTVAAAHTVGAAITVLGGDYTISKGYIYFTTPPYGPVGVNTLQPGISTSSKFAGRIFYRNNYDTNYIFDDISDQFTGNPGTGKTFILKSNQNNIEGISENNGVILINNIFQRPTGVNSTTDYILDDNGISGITTISFTGNTEDSIPKGGIINEIEVGVGTGYTTGSYSNLSLVGGSGSGAKVDIVIGAGTSILTYELKNRGIGYSPDDVLYLQSLSPVGINSATFKVLSTYTNKFSGWTFGQLIKIDDFSSQFDGVRKTFNLTKTTDLVPEPYSIETIPGSGLDLQNNLLVFVNDFLQFPGKDYIFSGGTQLTFTEAPSAGSKSKVLYYQGSTSDIISENPLQTIKIGDTLNLETQSNIPRQFNRIVTEIVSSDKVQTTDYSDIGISTNPNFVRPLTWTKQTSDLIIDSEIIDKSREYLEPRIRPTTRLIKDFTSQDSEVYVQSAFPDFNIIDNLSESSTSITIVQDTRTSYASANVSNVSVAGTITSLGITSSGSGFLDSSSITISAYSPSQIEEIGKTWSTGIVTTTASNLKDIKYVPDIFLFVVSDSNGGISTSTNATSWIRQTPSFTLNNELNSVSYGGNSLWVGVGSDAKVGYSTNNTNTWNAGIIYSYAQESGGIGRYNYTLSTTTRKFNSVAYGNNKFVAVGTGGTVIVSDNVYPAQTTWLLDGVINSSSPAGIGTVWLINNPSFVDINGNIISNITNTLNSITYSDVDQRFVCVGNSGVIVSSPIGNITNRQFRVERQPDAGYANLNDIKYINGKYFVVGDGGTVGYATSLIGPWNITTLSTSNNFNSITYTNNVYVIAGENGVVANSIDGINWIIKDSLTSTIYSVTNTIQRVVGVGSDSNYYISDSELSNPSITANIQNGSIQSFNIIDGGFGYTSSSDIQILISNPSSVYETLDSVAVKGDYGKIVGIGTSVSGIGTSSPMIIFSIQSDVGLNTTKIAGSSQVDPFVVRSGISTGDYFITSNTITGTGVTSIDVTSGIITVGVSTQYLDCVYIASKVDNNGVSGIVTVYANVVSIVGVASTSVTIDAVGFDTTGKVGNYSWGKFYNFSTRNDPKSFTAFNKNGFVGIETSPLIFRSTAIRAQYE